MNDQTRHALFSIFAGSEPSGYDTVGAVALDSHGHVAFASSTGGMTGKMPGRVGDTPILGK